MTTQEIWNLFIETGAPEFYLLYNKVRKMETTYVLDDSSIGSSYHSLQ